MKTVFSNQSQAMHIWANQSQPEGRTGNVFFRDSVIFSYGEHFAAAKIHKAKGKRFALVNSYRYSPSTGKHLSGICNALRGLMPYFFSSDVYDPIKALAEADKQAQGQLALALNRNKVTRKSDAQYEFAIIHEIFKTANDLRGIVKPRCKQKWPTTKQLDAIQAHFDKRLARYNELNTPEKIAEKKAAIDKKKLALAIETQKKLATDIQAFRQGANGTNHQLYSLPFELLRICGDTVQTSRGAEVALPEALKLYEIIKLRQSATGAIKCRNDIIGKAIGEFSVTDIYPLDNDTCIQMGCHKVLLSEATRVLKEKI